MLDGPAILYVLKPAAAINFRDYAQNAFLPYVGRELGKAHRINVECDNYRPDSLGAQTRTRDANESVAESSPIMQFQKNGENNAMLFAFLSNAVRISEQRNCHKVN